MEAYYIYLAMKIGNMKMKSMDTTGNILIFKEPASCNAWWWHWFDAGVQLQLLYLRQLFKKWTYNVAAEIVLYCFYVNVMWNRMKVNLWISSNNTYLEANKRSIKVLFSIWSSTKFKLKITSRTIRLKLDSLKWTRLTYNSLYCLEWHYIRPTYRTVINCQLLSCHEMGRTAEHK